MTDGTRQTLGAARCSVAAEPTRRGRGRAHASIAHARRERRGESARPVLELYRALRQEGSPVELILFPRETHHEIGQNFYGYPSIEPATASCSASECWISSVPHFQGSLTLGLQSVINNEETVISRGRGRRRFDLHRFRGREKRPETSNRRRRRRNRRCGDSMQCARAGAEVTLLEKTAPAAGATSKSFAWINPFMNDPHYMRMRLTALEALAGSRSAASTCASSGADMWASPTGSAIRVAWRFSRSTSRRRATQRAHSTSRRSSRSARRSIPAHSSRLPGRQLGGHVDPVHATQTVPHCCEGRGCANFVSVPRHRDRAQC